MELIDKNNLRSVVCLSFSLSLRNAALKVHKIENVFGSDFEFCVTSLLVMLKTKVL
jgi:hypothetical protein